MSDVSGPLKLSAVYEIRIPPENSVRQKLRTMLPDPNLRLKAGAEIACQDPAVAIELVRAACSMGHSDGRPPVTTLQAAINRLGANAGVETLEGMDAYEEVTDVRQKHWLDRYRRRGKWGSRTAQELASVLATSLVEDCQLAGSLLFVGDMLAILFFGHTYVELAESMSRPKILYKLEKEYSYDVDTIGFNYLEKMGIPEGIMFSLSEAGRAPNPSRTAMKPVMAAAREMVLTFDAGRWQRIAPTASIPPKSAIRMLNFSGRQYVDLYERLTEYLEAERAAEEQETCPT